MRHLEDKIQREIVKAVRLIYPRSICYSVPNGGSRNAREAGRLKQSGVLAGVSDLHIIHNGKMFFIEVKTEKGRSSEFQKDFCLAVRMQGFEYHIVKSTDDVLKILSIN